MKFAPKYNKHSCTGCIFLGQYKYAAPFATGPRRITVDLYCCIGKDASVIARYGADNKYASCPSDMLNTLAGSDGTYAEGMREAMNRAIALKLVEPQKPHDDWTDGAMFEANIVIRANDQAWGYIAADNVAAAIRSHLPGLAKQWKHSHPFINASINVKYAPWAAPSEPPQPSAPTPPPFDQRGFLVALANDARERARRLDRWADMEERKGRMSQMPTHETRKAANLYRIRAEAYEIARTELDRAMGQHEGQCASGSALVESIAPTSMGEGGQTPPKLELSLIGERHPYITTRELANWLNAAVASSGSDPKWDTDGVREVLVRSGALFNIPEQPEYKGTGRRPLPKTSRRQWVTTLLKLKDRTPDVFALLVGASSAVRMAQVLKEVEGKVGVSQ